jgi:hypothetical protein
MAYFSYASGGVETIFGAPCIIIVAAGILLGIVSFDGLESGVCLFHLLLDSG